MLKDYDETEESGKEEETTKPIPRENYIEITAKEKQSNSYLQLI